MTHTCPAPRFRDVLFITVLCLGGSAAFAATSAREILNAAGVEGGLVVHLSCGDGKLTAALRGDDRFLVHGLDASAANVTAARLHIQSLGAYGPVSIDRFDGKNLPYIDNHVNLIMAEDRHDVSLDEMMRVLVPLGVAYVKIHIYAADKQAANPANGASVAETERTRGRRGRVGNTPRDPEYIHVRGEHESETARLRKSLTSTAVNYQWSSHDPAMFGRAMVLAGETLFVAGPPAIRNEPTQEALQCWRGSQGGILWALSREDGTKLAAYDLPTTPVFDGMAAAYGRLYVSLTDGSVLCLQQNSE